MTDAPLRRVIAKFYWPTLAPSGVWIMALYEQLECGHVQRKKTSMFGPYKAVRRRCVACELMKKAKP